MSRARRRGGGSAQRSLAPAGTLLPASLRGLEMASFGWRLGMAGLRAMQSYKAEREFEEAMDAFEEDRVSGRGRHADFATLPDLEEVGVMQGLGGPYVGCGDGAPLFLKADRHLLAVASAGGGKSTRLAMPLIISLGMGQESARESCCVLDLKGELHFATAHGREALDGISPIVFAPWPIPWADSDTFNFLGPVIEAARRDANLADIARQYSTMVLGFDAAREGQGAWLGYGAIDLSVCVMAHLAATDPANCTPGALADVATLSQEQFTALMQTLTSSRAAGGFVADLAKKLLATYGAVAGEDQTRKYHGWLSDRHSQGWGLYAKGSKLRDFTASTSVDIRALRHRPQALYLCFPDALADSHGRFASVMLSALIETLAREDGPVRCTLVLDELSSYPAVAALPKALRLFRSRGIRIVAFTQDPEGLNGYKEQGGFKLFRENSYGLYWSVTDPKFCKDLSERAGYASHLLMGRSASHAAMMDQGGMNFSERDVPILPADKVPLIANGWVMLDAPGAPLAILQHPPFWELEFAAPYIVNARVHPMPHWEV